MGVRLTVLVATGVMLAGCGASVDDAAASAHGSGGGDSVTSAPGTDSEGENSAAEVGGEWLDLPPEKLDVSDVPEAFMACSDVPAVLDVRSAVTPDGPEVIVDGFASYDFCTGAVYVSLVPDHLPNVSDLILLIDQDGAHGAMYSGAYDTTQGGLGAPGGAAAVTFLTPWDSSEAFDADANPTLELRLELQVDGWDISADVTVPFCAGKGQCFCPCE